MTSFFSTTFLTALKAGGTASMTPGVQAQMYVFPNAPVFEQDDARYTSIDTITALSSTLGWGQYISALSSPVSVSVNTVVKDGATNYYVIQPNPHDLPNNFPATKPAALAFVYTNAGPDPAMRNKLMFVTNSIFSGGDIIIYNQDGIIPAPDSVNVGPTNNRWLMYWNIPTTGTMARAAEGEIVVQRGPQPFEAGRTQHVWMYPQRVNMIANPSFEAGTTHWKSNGTKTNPTPGINSAHYGHFVGTNPLILESNTFPVQIRKTQDEGWTIQVTARGNGELKIGLLTWPAAYDQTVCDWGPDLEPDKILLPTSWFTFRVLRRVFDQSTACLRLETNGTFLDIDRIICEPGFMPANGEDWPYFDGDSRYGALDDYSWYGNRDRPVGTPTREHQTYSCWYNHRRAMTGRLFQWALTDDGPGSVFTDEEVAAQGLVYNWVPAGTPVQQHLDVLFAHDPQSAIPDVTGGVVAYKTGAETTQTYRMGVKNPWL